RIWRNEAGGKVSALTHWNVGEDFASLGIGHFIWYPDGRRGPFVESFPALVDFMRDRGAPPPRWLDGVKSCPWADRAAFYADIDSQRMKSLRDWLAGHVDLQARFMIDRLERALPKVLDAAPQARRAELKARFDAV